MSHSLWCIIDVSAQVNNGLLYFIMCSSNVLFRYWNEPHFKALKIIQEAADKAGLTMAEVALRWVSHHSLMSREHGDSILIGASSLNHIEQVQFH